ncbi:MAG: DUF4230 domain-containing protein [Bacteroidota bacterium]
MDKKTSIFSRILGFFLAIPKKILGFFSMLGVLPMILVIITLLVGLFFGYKWMIGDFSSIVETKVSIVETPSILEEVRAIGELVGAEYFGEEVHSLSESYEEEDMKNMAESYLEIRDSYKRIYERIEKMRDINGNLIGHEKHLQKTYEDFMSVHATATNYDKAWFAAFKRIHNESIRSMLEYLRTNEWKSYYDHYKDRLNRERRYLRKIKNNGRVLIYLGRGTVKAGYNLDAMTEESVVRQGDTLLLKNLKAQILNADINPWYVLPEETEDGKGVPGFEVLKEYGSPTHQDHGRVKEGCEKDLEKSAIEQGILKTAEKRAEETLLNFLNLLARDSTQVLSIVDIQE